MKKNIEKKDISQSKKGTIPKEVLDRLNIKKINGEKVLTILPIIETHQIRLTIPSEIRREIDIKKGHKFEVIFDKKNKEITFKY